MSVTTKLCLSYFKPTKSKPSHWRGEVRGGEFQTNKIPCDTAAYGLNAAKDDFLRIYLELYTSY